MGSGSTGPEYAPSGIAVYRVAIDEVEQLYIDHCP